MSDHDCCGMGRGGNCICPKCQTLIAHRQGIRCQEERCPECGAKMLREGSDHHALWQRKQASRTD
ncbi:MAG: ferredoxin [Xanthomonadales bacterium]|nr:ferredoxin [Gammaproteobacteria bacterium]MBT8050627.1 ferredoxin [Gammaproteobacteria bacterium]MBT8057708.1 ferredoxin [Gammaproteobacteria bacterium]NNJ78139.1 ferredoxin [Xanthomonadales bacterium]NNL05790.1 ferredoxin [Xanthomonadales bacterium]